MTRASTLFSCLAAGLALTAGLAAQSMSPDMMADLLQELERNRVEAELASRTEQDSPLRFSGQVWVSQVESTEGLYYSYSYDLHYSNVTNKTILTLVIALDVHHSSGFVDTESLQYECFFAPDVIRPGETHDFKRPLDSIKMVTTPPRVSTEPRAEPIVLFAQFLDGSTFGAPPQAHDILLIRRLTLNALHRLDRAFVRGGEEEFLEELAEPVDPSAVNTLIDNVRHAATTLGTQEAIARVRYMLDFAAEHEALIRGNSPGKP